MQCSAVQTLSPSVHVSIYHMDFEEKQRGLWIFRTAWGFLILLETQNCLCPPLSHTHRQTQTLSLSLSHYSGKHTVLACSNVQMVCNLQPSERNWDTPGRQLETLFLCTYSTQWWQTFPTPVTYKLARSGRILITKVVSIEKRINTG